MIGKTISERMRSEGQSLTRSNTAYGVRHSEPWHADTYHFIKELLFWMQSASPTTHINQILISVQTRLRMLSC